MSITDELRKWAKEHLSRNSILAIADRIDIEHKKAVDIAFTNGRTEGIADGCAYYDTEHTECMLSEEHGWIRLPKDADGVPIHIGDELDGYGYPKGGAYCKAILNEVMILAGPKDSSYRSWLMWDSTEVRHHHEPTVEDVLDEFASAYDRIGGEDEEHQKYLDLIAEYAAKLQLRGDGE